MKTLLSKILFSFSIFFIGCQTPNVSNIIPSSDNDKCEPTYFENYQRKDNEIVGIGIAPMNIHGFDAQRKSAISKAIDEIARQLGVKVSSVSKSKTSLSGRQVNRSYSSYSMQTVDGNKVNAKIIKACKADDGNYYVLMKVYK